MIKVFHRSSLWLPFMDMPLNWPDSFELAAEVPAPAETAADEALCEHAYRLTQNLDSVWTEDYPDLATGASLRSTSVGDVIVVNDHVYVCVDFGWEEIK